MPIAVPPNDKSGKAPAGAAAGPAPTGGRGLKGLFSRNKIVSPEPMEPARSRFRSIVDDVTARGLPGTRKDRGPKGIFGAAVPNSQRVDDDRTPRPTVRPRPASPDMTAKRGGRVGIALPPAMQKGNDGKWQPPSLSKGSMSTSALARLRDTEDEDERTARPLDIKKGKPALHALFDAGGVNKGLAARMERRSPVGRTIKLPSEDKSTPLSSRLKAGASGSKRSPVAPTRSSATTRPPQPPVKPSPPLSMKAPPTVRSASQTPIDRPGSRHTSRIQVSQPSSPTHPHLAIEHYYMRLATSFLLKQLTPIIKGSGFASKESNAEMRRLADDRLATLGRIEKNWGPDWIRAAADVKEAGDSGVQEGQVRMANVGERAKERERKAFLEGMRDGVLLCL